MKKLLASMLICGTILTGTALGASPQAGPLVVNGAPVGAEGAAQIHANTTYVSLRALAQRLRPEACVTWEEGQAAVRTADLALTARPGDTYIQANGRALPVPHGVRAAAGRVLVPVRVLAQAMGAQVDWDAATGTVTVTGGGAIEDASTAYDAQDLYWLSRIVSAESQGEPLQGQIAVANVVLNRVKSSQFPNTIYGVIFDRQWGVQFTPVANGTIYHEPASQSVLAAKLALEGASAAAGSLYFLAPEQSTNHWVSQNRELVTVIGSHWFYR